MKAMQDGHSAKDLDGDTGGRHTRALAKRCIVLTEENRVTISGRRSNDLAYKLPFRRFDIMKGNKP